MAWDNMADHVVDDYEAIGLPFKDEDYPNRMQPHKFGDDAFVVIEKWESPEALRAHAGSPHMAAYAAKTRDLIESRVIHVLQPG